MVVDLPNTELVNPWDEGFAPNMHFAQGTHILHIGINPNSTQHHQALILIPPYIPAGPANRAISVGSEIQPAIGVAANSTFFDARVHQPTGPITIDLSHITDIPDITHSSASREALGDLSDPTTTE